MKNKERSIYFLEKHKLNLIRFIRSKPKFAEVVIGDNETKEVRESEV